MIPENQLLEWPEQQLPVQTVRQWISANLLGQPVISEPAIIYRVNEWGVTARFTAQTDYYSEDFVFKANFLPLSLPAATNYVLSAKHCVGVVPDLVAYVEEPDNRKLLFRPFYGQEVSKISSLSAYCAMARTMAQIQNTVAALDNSEKQHLSLLELGQLTTYFEILIERVETQFLPIWSGENDAFAQGRLPKDILISLKKTRPQVKEWVGELQAGNWPYSIDHVDLHSDNAIVIDGSDVSNPNILIYDWEEAVLGFPFFSLDKLLYFSPTLSQFKTGKEASAEVRRSYLETIEWKTYAERECAFEVALKLSPIRYAFADLAFAQAMGWSPTVAAQAVAGWLAGGLLRWK